MAETTPESRFTITLYASVGESDDVIRLGSGNLIGDPEDWFRHLPVVVRALADELDKTYADALVEVLEELEEKL